MSLTGSYPPNPTLVEYPHPALRAKAAQVTIFNDQLRAFCAHLFTVMESHAGVGLAAPQVAVSKRIFVTDHLWRKDGNGGGDRRVFINPVIEQAEGSTSYEEGCLSFPGIYAKVHRHNRFDLRYQDEHGVQQVTSFDVEAGHFLGIVIQHELDHLDGVAFVDHLVPAQLTLIRRKLRDLETDYKKATGKAGLILRR